MGAGLKSRKLLEADLRIIREVAPHSEFNPKRGSEAAGAEAALLWLLSGETSWAPLSLKILDPTSRLDVSEEAHFAYDVWYGQRSQLSEAAAAAAQPAMYAKGVHWTLGWACGNLPNELTGRDDEDVVEDLALHDAEQKASRRR